jgi:hypothetical protein
LKQKYRLIITLGFVQFVVSSCTSSPVPENQGGYYYDKIYFGKNLSIAYQKGIIDGCTTAKGKYKKSHTLFNNNTDYNVGWFLGRNKCKSLLKIDKEGNLIL